MNRDKILSGIFKFIAFEILPEFKDNWDRANRKIQEYGNHAKSRINELYTNFYMILEKVLKYIPNSEYSVSGSNHSEIAELLIADWFTVQNKIESETVSGTNDILNRLELLISEILMQSQNLNEFHQTYHIVPEIIGDRDGTGKVINPKSIMFEIRTRDLYMAFTMLAKTRNFPCPFENPRQLGARLKNSMKILIDNGWTIEPIKKIKGNDIYRYSKMMEA